MEAQKTASYTSDDRERIGAATEAVERMNGLVGAASESGGNVYGVEKCACAHAECTRGETGVAWPPL